MSPLVVGLFFIPDVQVLHHWILTAARNRKSHFESTGFTHKVTKKICHRGVIAKQINLIGVHICYLFIFSLVVDERGCFKLNVTHK